MSCNNCNGLGHKDCLIAYFNTNDSDSWDGASGSTVDSLLYWDSYKTSKIELKDYGLTMMDVGRSESMFSDTREFGYNDRLLSLYPMGYADFSGNTFQYGTIEETLFQFGPSGNTTDTRLISISDGAYYSNFFKIHGYDYELLPHRFKNGYTFSIRLYIESFKFGYFFYFGTRAENKYAKDICEEKFTYDSLGANLGADHESDLELGVKGNSLGFYINKLGNIGYTYINSEGGIKDAYSCNALKLGFNNIDIAFFPYNSILDIDCSPRRLGLLKVYVNGVLFWQVENFEEIILNALSTPKEHQIGVPYNISWGGATEGLKESLRYKKSDDYWLRERIVSGLQYFIDKVPALQTNYSPIFSYSGDTIASVLLTNDLTYVNPYPYFLRTGKISIKSDHIYRVVFDVESDNGLNSIPLLQSIEIKIDGIDSTIAEICTPIGDIGNTGDTRWVYEVYFHAPKNCIEYEGYIYINYNKALLPRVPRFIVRDYFVNEIFYNYLCRTEYCLTSATGTTLDCNNNPIPVVIDSEPCQNIYQYHCDMKGLLIETLYSGKSFEGMLHKLRVYCKPLGIMEVQQNWINDQKEVGVKVPMVGIDQTQPNTGKPNKFC